MFLKAIFESLALCLISSLYTFQRLESCVLYLLYGQLLKHIFSSAAGHFWPLFDRMKITSETQLNYHRQFYKKIWQVYIYCGGSFLSIHIGEKKFTCGLESKYFWAKRNNNIIYLVLKSCRIRKMLSHFLRKIEKRASDISWNISISFSKQLCQFLSNTINILQKKHSKNRPKRTHKKV